MEAGYFNVDHSRVIAEKSSIVLTSISEPRIHSIDTPIQ